MVISLIFQPIVWDIVEALLPETALGLRLFLDKLPVVFSVAHSGFQDFFLGGWGGGGGELG